MQSFAKIKSSRKFRNLQYSYFVCKISHKLCMLGIVCFISSADFLFKINFFFQNILSDRNTIRVSNSWDPDQGGHFVGPDPCPLCFAKIIRCLKLLLAKSKLKS